MKRVLLACVLVTMLGCDVFSHEVRPAYLELRQTASDVGHVPGVGDGPCECPSAATDDSACAADPLVFIGSASKAVIIAPANATTQTCLRAKLPLPAIMPQSTPRLRIICPYQPGRPVSFGVLQGEPI